LHLKGFGCQDKIRIGDREFQIHTGCDTNKNKALAEVFEKGNFIFDVVRPYRVRERSNEPVDEKYLKKKVSDLHQQILDEIFLLFQISQKIKPLNQYLPHFRLGKVFLGKNFYKEAVENLERAIELKSDQVQPYKLLGIAYLKLSDHNNALRVFEMALEKNATDPELLNALSVLYTQTGNFNTAKDILQKAMAEHKTYLELNLNFGIVLFLSTIAENPHEEHIIVPPRVIRALKDIRILDRYSDDTWQSDFNNLLEIIENGKKSEISDALFDIQLKMITEGNLYSNVDLFFLKFMYGGKEMSRREIDIFEGKTLAEESQHGNLADYWNDMAILHLVQCRDNFLKAIDDFEHSTKLNSKFEDAQNTLEMIKRGKKGFLILLRAILK